jgi:hypothetical protein
MIGIRRNHVETSPGIYSSTIEEVEVSGEIRRPGVRWPQADQGDGLKAKHIFSMITPEGDDIDFVEVVYIIWRGRKWAVTNIEYKPPRVEYSFGGLYNG